MTKRNATFELHVYLTADEFKRIEDRAKELSLPTSTYIRLLALGKIKE